MASGETSALKQDLQDGHAAHASRWSRPASFLVIAVVYVVATGGAVGVCFGYDADGFHDPIFVGAVGPVALCTVVSHCDPVVSRFV